jgi:hypothetical protein
MKSLEISYYIRFFFIIEFIFDVKGFASFVFNVLRACHISACQDVSSAR